MTRPLRAALLGVGLVVAAWIGVRTTLTFAPPVRDAWTLIAVGADTNVLYARWSVASTGFYDRQLTSHFWLLEQNGQVVESRAMYGPARFDDDGVRSEGELGGPDHLERHFGQSWDGRVGGAGAQLTAKVTGTADGCPLGVGTLHALVSSTPGTDAGGYDGGELVNGPAVVVRTRATGVVKGSALYVLGNGASLGIDPLATCPAWAVIGKDAWSGPALPLTGGPQGEVSLGRWTVTWRPTSAHAASSAYDHLLGAERWLAIAAGWPTPTLQILRVGVRIRGPGFDEPRTGVLLVRGTTIGYPGTAPGS